MKNTPMLSANELDNHQAQAQHETEEERQRWRDTQHVLVKTERAGSKKNRGPVEYDYSLKPDIPLRINYDRFNVLIRDELIVRAAEDRWNRGVAEVLRATLIAALGDDSHLSDGRTYNAVGFNDILDSIPSSAHPYLFAGMTGISSSSSKAIPEIVRQYLRILVDEDALSGSGTRFLSSDSDRTYRVELELISNRMRESMMAELVRERLGSKAARVLSVVAKAGKISETMVSCGSQKSNKIPAYFRFVIMP
jgi:DNA-directed RNA polymerase III subunit RPC3